MQKLQDQLRQLKADLGSRFPKVFESYLGDDASRDQCFAIGIGDDIQSRFGPEAEKVGSLLIWLTRTKRYRHNLVQEGSVRCDLDGVVVGPVDVAHKVTASNMLLVTEVRDLTNSLKRLPKPQQKQAEEPVRDVTQKVRKRPVLSISRKESG